MLGPVTPFHLGRHVAQEPIVLPYMSHKVQTMAEIFDSLTQCDNPVKVSLSLDQHVLAVHVAHLPVNG
jgi:hypothetical protein